MIENFTSPWMAILDLLFLSRQESMESRDDFAAPDGLMMVINSLLLTQPLRLLRRALSVFLEVRVRSLHLRQ